MLGAVDPEELAKALNLWMQSQQEKGELPDFLSINGKVIATNLATIVSLADATDGSPVAQAAASGNGQDKSSPCCAEPPLCFGRKPGRSAPQLILSGQIEGILTAKSLF